MNYHELSDSVIERDDMTLCPEATLPRDFPRSRVRSNKRASVVSEESSAKQPSLSVLVAAVAAVLGRYTGHGRVCLGLAPREASEPDHAPFVSVAVDQNQSLAKHAEDLEAAIDVARTGPAPHLPYLAERFGGGDIVDRNAIFSVAVCDAVDAEALRDVWTDAVVLRRADGGLEIDYSVRLFHEKTVHRFLGHIARMLEGAADDPQTPIESLDLIGSAEREDILKVAGLDRLGAPQGTPVHMLVESIARERGEDCAVEGATEARSYDWLRRRSNDYAHALDAAGAQPGDRIGIGMAADEQAVAALLGILKAGMTAVPLDRTLPTQRSAGIAQTAAIKAAFITASFRDSFPDFADVTVLDPGAVSVADSDWTIPPTEDELPVYILFTSGSTGIPKGVAMPHRALSNLIAWQLERSASGNALRTLQRTSIAFDVGFQETFSTLCAGGVLVIANDDMRADVSQLQAIITEKSITRTFLPPVALHQLAESADLSGEVMATLEEVIVAGEQLRISPAIRQMFRHVGAYLENQYGPTETHVATAYRLKRPVTSWPELPPVGEPIDGAVVLVVDEDMRPKPHGIVGEIAIGGLCVASGYLDDLPGTERAFVDGSAILGPGKFRTLYRTGDYGRTDVHGHLHFEGRRDDQVKIRGYRVELGELQTVLSRMRGISESAVVVDGDALGGRRIVVHVVTEQPGVPDAATIRRNLERQLPPFMVPSLGCILHRDSMPLLTTGKVDRSALEVPGVRIAGEGEAHVSLDGLEEGIAAIWARNLEVASVGPEDDFLELGGHSLLAIKIIAEINAWLGITVPLAHLLRGRTVVAVADAARAIMKRSVVPAAAAPEVRRSAKEVVLPDGRTIQCWSSSEALYFYRDIFEHRTYAKHGIAYPDEACIIDAGGNIGLFALFALDRSPKARIYSFEPVPALHEILARNLKQWSPRATAIAEALGAAEGPATIAFYPEQSGMSSFASDRERDARLLNQIVANLSGSNDALGRALLPSDTDLLGNRFSIEQVGCTRTTLSQFIARAAIDRVHLLKIDVQRGERDVLAGVAREDWSRIDQVVVEVHDEEGALDAIRQLLEANGFAVAVEQDPIHAETPVKFVYAHSAR